MNKPDTECHCSRTNRYHHKDSTYQNHSVERCWTDTPDTEEKCNCTTWKNKRGFSMSHELNCPRNTPDTEVEKIKATHYCRLCTNMGRDDGSCIDRACRCECHAEWERNFNALEFQEFQDGRWYTNIEKLKAYIHSLLSSRDTYWKERVRKEVEGMKKDIRTETGPTNEEDWDIHCGKIWGWNQALDTLSENLTKGK